MPAAAAAAAAAAPTRSPAPAAVQHQQRGTAGEQAQSPGLCAHLKVLPRASNTTAKCVGGGWTSSRLNRVERKPNSTVVSSPVCECGRARGRGTCRRGQEIGGRCSRVTRNPTRHGRVPAVQTGLVREQNACCTPAATFRALEVLHPWPRPPPAHRRRCAGGAPRRTHSGSGRAAPWHRTESCCVRREDAGPTRARVGEAAACSGAVMEATAGGKHLAAPSMPSPN